MAVRFGIGLALGLCFALVGAGGVVAAEETESIPSPPREFRGVWVATVGNIDWPSKPGLTTEEQKQEAIAILDKCKEDRFNAVVFQVRPQADAMYKSSLEPWSSYLTGMQGKAPDPYYDPLEFWVAEAHARGLELHCWFNPYRANSPANKGGICDQSIIKTHPELVVKLGEKGYYWMNPALEGVKKHSLAVCMDVVNRYDIDGVHFDDYFYPYWDYNDGKDFPDDATWDAFQKSGHKLTRKDFPTEAGWKKYKAAGYQIERNDWRRLAVDSFIKDLYGEIKKAKPRVKFGISPFGIWRPGYPPSIKGFDQYDKLYADAKLWFNEGWVDYFSPQLYWPISKIPQSYPVLLGWWQEQNTKERHLWPGLSIGGANREGGVTETINQIMVTRGMLPNDPGNIVFSEKVLQRDAGEIGEKLLAGPYADTALVPPSPWLDDKAPDAPRVTTSMKGANLDVAWTPQGKEAPFLWVVYTKQGDRWSYEILPGSSLKLTRDLTPKAPADEAKAEKTEPPATVTKVAVSVVGRTGKEREKEVVEVK